MKQSGRRKRTRINERRERNREGAPLAV